MCEYRSCKQKSLLFQFLEDQRISLLYEDSVPVCSSAHLALCINELYERKSVLPAYSGVVFTESRSVVNYSCTVCSSNIVISYDIEGILASACLFSKIEEWLIVTSNKILALELLNDLGLFSELCLYK